MGVQMHEPAGVFHIRGIRFLLGENGIAVHTGGCSAPRRAPSPIRRFRGKARANRPGFLPFRRPATAMYGATRS
jgi:hypothetical protein